MKSLIDIKETRKRSTWVNIFQAKVVTVERANGRIDIRKVLSYNMLDELIVDE